MAEKPISLEEIRQWQQEYRQFERDWINWLRENEADYNSGKDALIAFKEQWPGNAYFLNL